MYTKQRASLRPGTRRCPRRGQHPAFLRSTVLTLRIKSTKVAWQLFGWAAVQRLLVRSSRGPWPWSSDSEKCLEGQVPGLPQRQITSLAVRVQARGVSFCRRYRRLELAQLVVTHQRTLVRICPRFVLESLVVVSLCHRLRRLASHQLSYKPACLIHRLTPQALG